MEEGAEGNSGHVYLEAPKLAASWVNQSHSVKETVKLETTLSILL